MIPLPATSARRLSYGRIINALDLTGQEITPRHKERSEESADAYITDSIDIPVRILLLVRKSRGMQ